MSHLFRIFVTFFLSSFVRCLLYISVNRFLQNDLTTQFERVKCVKI